MPTRHDEYLPPPNHLNEKGDSFTVASSSSRITTACTFLNTACLSSTTMSTTSDGSNIYKGTTSGPPSSSYSFPNMNNYQPDIKMATSDPKPNASQSQQFKYSLTDQNSSYTSNDTTSSLYTTSHEHSTDKFTIGHNYGGLAAIKRTHPFIPAASIDYSSLPLPNSLVESPQATSMSTQFSSEPCIGCKENEYCKKKNCIRKSNSFTMKQTQEYSQETPMEGIRESSDKGDTKKGKLLNEF